MEKLDADIRDAMKALENTVPERYFDEFESRLEARLEVEAMAGPQLLDQGKGMDDSPPPMSPKSSEENTGLHDIKELARSQKRRISKRQTTQSEVEQSLLASSSALSAVALPEPGKDKQTFETADTKLAMPTASTTGARVAERSEENRGLPVWIFAAVGVVAAAAVVFFIVRGGKGDSDESAKRDKVALGDTANGEGPGSRDKAGNKGFAPTSSAADSPSAKSSGTSDSDGDDMSGDGVSIDDPAPAPDSTDDSAAGTTEGTHKNALTRDDDADDNDKKKTDASKDGDSSKDRDKAAAAKKAKDAEKDAKTDKKDSTSAKADNKKDVTKDTVKDTKGGGDTSLDDLLNNASGGAADTGGGKKDEETAPSKKKLSSTDIKSGMSPIMGSVKGCFDGEPGTVTIKFSVDPSGKVSKAYATGKFSGTKAGECVAKLVKSATFSAFDGRSSTFTFPFLLTQ